MCTSSKHSETIIPAGVLLICVGKWSSLVWVHCLCVGQSHCTNTIMTCKQISISLSPITSILSLKTDRGRWLFGVIEPVWVCVSSRVTCPTCCQYLQPYSCTALCEALGFSVESLVLSLFFFDSSIWLTGSDEDLCTVVERLATVLLGCLCAWTGFEGLGWCSRKLKTRPEPRLAGTVSNEERRSRRSSLNSNWASVEWLLQASQHPFCPYCRSNGVLTWSPYIHSYLRSKMPKTKPVEDI